MRKKWIIGIVIGLFFLYVSYFGVTSIGLTLYPNRTTNLKAGMSWTTLEGSYTYTYNVTSVVGSKVYIHQREVTGTVDEQLVIDVTDTKNALVVASGLGLGDELVEMNGSMIGYPSDVYIYVNSTESVSGKTLLVGQLSFTYQGMPFGYTLKYYQDSGVLYSMAVMMNGVTQTVIQCTSGDPITSTYTITASAGTGGSISPSGSVIVTQGNSQTFTITPNNGYTVSGIIVDGVNKGTITSYTFSNVQASHTISASFNALPPNQYSISASAGTGGSISPSGSILVNQGSNQAFTITANNGYTTSAVLVDGTNQGAITSYTFTNVQTSHTISASFSSTDQNYYFNLILGWLHVVLGNSQLMLIAGALTTLTSLVMLFLPKPSDSE
jgi:hypothetical protein